jgi:epoxyqueuosine reductase
MKILLHTCCAPCSIYPVEILRDQRFEVTGFFFRSNIHPYSECLKRQQTLENYSVQIKMPVIYQQGYDLEGFLQKLIYREKSRCAICYYERLVTTASIAKKGFFDCFSSTLLYSKFQKHDLIKQIGESIASSIGIPFNYCDFRKGWKEGIEASKRLDLYRQQYCGCIYSEKERFYSIKS